MAAKFEFEVMVSPSSARSLFQRALRLMPNEKKLWLEVMFFSSVFNIEKTIFIVLVFQI